MPRNIPILGIHKNNKGKYEKKCLHYPAVNVIYKYFQNCVCSFFFHAKMEQLIDVIFCTGASERKLTRENRFLEKCEDNM